MAYNVLILASATLPVDATERRRLGLPRRAGPGPLRCVRLEGVPPRLAALLKRWIASAGGSAEFCPGLPGRGRVVLLTGGASAFGDLVRTAARHPTAGIAAREIALALHHRDARPTSPAHSRLPIGRRTLVMGVLNVTPDSFSDGGRHPGRRAAVRHALRMASEGADIIDIGGESTRPGAAPVSAREELRRVLPVLGDLVESLGRRSPPRPLLSIDTIKAEVARRAAATGAHMINDISGLGSDPAMPAVVAETALPVVISHIRGRPRTMQRSPRYAWLLPEIAAFLRDRIDLAVRAGVREDRIIIDPGLGFGKRHRDNLAILKHLSALRSLGRPILIGASRKSFIGKGLDLPVGERLEGSLAAEALAIAGGADIIRAHDVVQAVRVARLCDAVLRGQSRQR